VVWIALVWAAVLAGFGLDFARYLGESPPPPFILHFHAAVYVLWLGLVTLQILWVEVGNLRRHKQLGWLTVAVSVLMVPLGIEAAVVDQARQVTHPDYAPQFLSLEFEEMFAFSIFTAGGVIFRRNPAAHKRLMLSVAPGTHSSSGGIRRDPALDWRDRRDHSRLLANMARHDGSAGRCLGLCGCEFDTVVGRGDYCIYASLPGLV
jgi:hypothetical protein